MSEDAFLIFFDEVIAKYKKHFDKNDTENLAKSIKNELDAIFKKHKIVVVSDNNIEQAKKWFIENGLDGYIHAFVNIPKNITNNL